MCHELTQTGKGVRGEGSRTIRQSVMTLGHDTELLAPNQLLSRLLPRVLGTAGNTTRLSPRCKVGSPDKVHTQPHAPSRGLQKSVIPYRRCGSGAVAERKRRGSGDVKNRTRRHMNDPRGGGAEFCLSKKDTRRGLLFPLSNKYEEYFLVLVHS